MSRRKRLSGRAGLASRSLDALTRSAMRLGKQAMDLMVKAATDSRRPPPGDGEWIAGIATGSAGARRFWLYRPPEVHSRELLPLMVMLHGCGQTAKSFAIGTRMNRLAARERFFVLYPEQDRAANGQGCWNWFDTRSGRAYGEASLILKAIDQVCLLYPVDQDQVAVAGLSAGASMAALLAARYPERFKAVIMHSGVPPGVARSGLSALGAMHGHRLANHSRGIAAGPWPPLLVIHGGKDPVVAASNAEAAARMWIDAAGACSARSRQVQRGRRHAMSVTDFQQGRSIVATLVQVGALGHAWSGGAANQPYCDALGPDASRMAWRFAARQFRK